jgi:hypothetical protein
MAEAFFLAAAAVAELRATGLGQYAIDHLYDKALLSLRQLIDALHLLQWTKK